MRIRAYQAFAISVPPSVRWLLDPRLPRVDVLVFGAHAERAGPAEQDGKLVVEVVAQPGDHAGAGLEPHGLPAVPQRGEPGDRLGVLPSLGAPPELPAQRATEHGQEVAGHPFIDAVVDRPWG